MASLVKAKVKPPQEPRLSVQERSLMSQKTKKAFAVPHTYTIIFALMVLVAALTWVVPSGVFDTAEVNGQIGRAHV